MINLTINNQKISVEEGTTVLAAAKKLNLNIPTLCNHDDLCVAGNCRVCVVEQTGARTLIASCATPVSEGMPENILLNSFFRSTGPIAQNAIKIRIASCSRLQTNTHLVIIFFLILLKISITQSTGHLLLL